MSTKSPIRSKSPKSSKNVKSPKKTGAQKATSPQKTASPKKTKNAMPYRFLGKTGLRVSLLSFGSWVTFGSQIPFDDAFNLCKVAYDAGVNFFDNAEAYASGESEITMGKIFKKAGWARKDYVVSTKIFWGGSGPNDQGLSRKHIHEAMNGALKRLQLDYIDLVFCHRPDPYTPIEETVRAMNDLISSGKAFYWGTSEWSAAEFTEACYIARELRLIAPIMEQPEYSMFCRQRFEVEYAPLYQKLGMGTTIWSPLASGLLTGKYNNGIPKDSRFDSDAFPYPWKKALLGPEGPKLIAKLNKLSAIAKTLDCSLAQLAIAWCTKNKDVSTVILGASKVSQLEENLKALEVAPKLTCKVMEDIEKILDNKPTAPRIWRSSI